VLSEFRSRLVAGDLTSLALDALLERLAGLGLVRAGGRQRTDSTHGRTRRRIGVARAAKRPARRNPVVRFLASAQSWCARDDEFRAGGNCPR